MEEAQNLEEQRGKEPAGKPLASFSSADILEELSGRFHANPGLIYPTDLKKFDEVVAEIIKKLTPEETKTCSKQTAKPGGAEIQASSESEGKKWAKILREKGQGSLEGKFRKSWMFVNPEGEREQVSNEEGPYASGGSFGNKAFYFIGKPRIADVEGKFLPKILRSDFPSSYARGAISNSLIVVGAESTEGKFSEWNVFRYSSYLENAPDARGGVIKLNFDFSLPPEESRQFIKVVMTKPDLVEDVFQNVYPGFTGGAGPMRFTVKRLTVIDNVVAKIQESPISAELRKIHRDRKPSYEVVVDSACNQVLNFSKPVGEIAP